MIDADVHDATQRRMPLWRIIAGVIIAVGALSLVISTAGGLSETVDAVRRIEPGWIVAAIGVAAIRQLLYARQLRRLNASAIELSPAMPILLALTLYGFGAVTPASPAEGLVIAGGALRRAAMPQPRVTLMLGFSQWFTQRTFYAVTALNLLAVIALNRLPARDSWPLVLVALLVIAALAVSAWAAHTPTVAARATVALDAVRLHGKPRRDVTDARSAGTAWHATAMQVVGTPANRVRLAVLSAAAVVADGATLGCACRGAGIHVPFDVALLAATIGTIASWIPLLPAGLGVVEAVIPSILHHFNASADNALAATLAYRGVGTLLPAAIGLVAVALLRRHRNASETDPHA